MKIIIAGSRSILDYACVAHVLDDYFYTISEVVCGCASGVDSLGAQWGRERHISVAYFPADWRPNGVYDKAAGYKRNTRMGEYADGLLAFWDGVSRGTHHMVDIMVRLKKPYNVFLIK